MTDNLLRTRIFTSLMIGLGVTACGGQTGSDGGSGGACGTGGGGAAGSGGTSSGASGGVDASGGAAGFGGVYDASFDAPVDSGLCSWGTPATSCFTPAEAQAMANNPPQGGDAPPDDAGFEDGGPSDAGVDENGCPLASRIQDGCCNPAAAGPDFVSGTCCYVFCAGGCCGRPFTVGGSSRKASLSSGRGSDELCDASPAAREAARQWREDGLMEHASIAAFARHSAELMALGAPRRLMQASLSAQRDEVVHAALCFSLAEQLDGLQQEPSGLPTQGALDDVDPRGVLTRLIREGCIEETIAAAIASEQLAVATHLRSHQALARIADDEARHAAYSWECLAWLLKTGAPDLRQLAEREFSSVLSGAVASSGECGSDRTGHAFGRLSDTEVDATRQRTLREVIAPSWLDLLEQLAQLTRAGQPSYGAVGSKPAREATSRALA